MAKEFTDSEMDNLLAQESLIVIDFWAEWCGPCKKLSPVIDELAEEYDGVVDIRKCDVEENVEVASKFGVMAIPTIVLVKNGKEITRRTGTIKKDQLKSLIEPRGGGCWRTQRLVVDSVSIIVAIHRSCRKGCFPDRHRDCRAFLRQPHSSDQDHTCSILCLLEHRGFSSMSHTSLGVQIPQCI